MDSSKHWPMMLSTLLSRGRSRWPEHQMRAAIYALIVFGPELERLPRQLAGIVGEFSLRIPVSPDTSAEEEAQKILAYLMQCDISPDLWEWIAVQLKRMGVSGDRLPSRTEKLLRAMAQPTGERDVGAAFLKKPGAGVGLRLRRIAGPGV